MAVEDVISALLPATEATIPAWAGVETFGPSWGLWQKPAAFYPGSGNTPIYSPTPGPADYPQPRPWSPRSHPNYFTPQILRDPWLPGERQSFPRVTELQRGARPGPPNDDDPPLFPPWRPTEPWQEDIDAQLPGEVTMLPQMPPYRMGMF